MIPIIAGKTCWIPIYNKSKVMNLYAITPQNTVRSIALQGKIKQKVCKVNRLYAC